MEGLVRSSFADYEAWTLWSDMIIHRIHRRVLLHIKSLAENTADDSSE